MRHRVPQLGPPRHGCRRYKQGVRWAAVRSRRPLGVGLLCIVGAAALAAAEGTAGDAGPGAAPRAGPAAHRGPRFVDAFDAGVFHRGNLHTHTLLSDGDSSVEEVVRWYREHGYRFLAITDHNRRLDPSRDAGLATDGFVLLSGEEVTLDVDGAPVHVNALCTARTIGAARFRDRAAALAWAVEAARVQGGVALVNHPNFHYALDAAVIARAPGAHLFEIWSGHPEVRSAGDATHPSAEALWEELLTQGAASAPAAVDDMHRLGTRPRRDGERAAPRALPGRGWVEVFVPALTEAAICDALREGHLYASNGPRLRRLTVRGDTLTVGVVEPDALVELLGPGGRLLAQVRLGAAGTATRQTSYRLTGGERFVRVRVTLPDGARAWTPAYQVAASVHPVHDNP
jgi:hypothetical protein